MRDIVALPDPVGEVIDGFRLANGLDVRKVRVPLGVVAVVYEARPNVTIDAAALCLKSGNAVVLRGSSTAAHSNAVLAAVAIEAGLAAGLPDGAMALVAGGGHEELEQLATQTGVVDLIIPRGGEGLKKCAEGRGHGAGHVRRVGELPRVRRRDRVARRCAGDRLEREDRSVRACATRPRRCWCTRRSLMSSCRARSVPCRRRESSCGLTRAPRRLRATCRSRSATEEDWATEYHALTLAVGVVDSAEEAIEHINRYGSGHSEAIVTRDTESARAFQLGVDAACVYVNASTRFTDGGEFGMGAEIGNSTQKLHARGPIGLRELCSFKYLVEGSGHVRA